MPGHPRGLRLRCICSATLRLNAQCSGLPSACHGRCCGERSDPEVLASATPGEYSSRAVAAPRKGH